MTPAQMRTVFAARFPVPLLALPKDARPLMLQTLSWQAEQRWHVIHESARTPWLMDQLRLTYLIDARGVLRDQTPAPLRKSKQYRQLLRCLSDRIRQLASETGWEVLRNGTLRGVEASKNR